MKFVNDGKSTITSASGMNDETDNVVLMYDLLLDNHWIIHTLKKVTKIILMDLSLFLA